MGLFETDGPAYGLFGAQAGLIASYLKSSSDSSPDPRPGQFLNPSPANPLCAEFDRLRRNDRRSLRGGVKYVTSARHGYYVKFDVYEKALARAAKTLI